MPTTTELIALAFLVLVAGRTAAMRIFNKPPPSALPLLRAERDTLRGAGSALGPYDEITFESESPKAIIVFIPGNPGMPGYYSDFASTLRTNLQATVVCMGLIGHLELSSRVKLPRREAALAPSVEAQVEHVAVRSLPYMRQAQDAGVPFVFIGHSIGAWIALHAERRMRAPAAATPEAINTTNKKARPRSSPKRERPSPAATGGKPAPRPYLLFITPFLDVPSCRDPSVPNINFLRRVFKPLVAGVSLGRVLAGPFAGLAGLVRGVLPERLMLRVAKTPGIASDLSEKYTALAIQETIHRHQVRNILLMANTEFASLAAPMDTKELLAPLAKQGRLRALYVPGDQWAPLSMGRALEKEAGVFVDVYESRDESELQGASADPQLPASAYTMQHAFSVQPGSCFVVARWADAALREMWSLPPKKFRRQPERGDGLPPFKWDPAEI